VVSLDNQMVRMLATRPPKRRKPSNDPYAAQRKRMNQLTKMLVGAGTNSRGQGSTLSPDL
jgi:hypothetical protein